MRPIPTLVALALTIAAPPLFAQDLREVRFAAGATAAEASGTVTGEAYVDYRLGARAGQKMSVKMQIDKNGYFNVLPPGSAGEAIFTGSMEGDAFSAVLPADGAYTVRVYLMGADADEGAMAAFTLRFAIED